MLLANDKTDFTIRGCSSSGASDDTRAEYWGVIGAGAFSTRAVFRPYHRRGIITEVPLLSEPLMSMGPRQWAAYVASRILVASKNGGFDRVLLGSSLQKLDYQ